MSTLLETIEELLFGTISIKLGISQVSYQSINTLLIQVCSTHN